LFTACATAQQYKWTEKDGAVRYGDTPPPGVNATRLKPPPSGPAAADAKGDTRKAPPLSPDAAFRKRREEEREAEGKAAKERADEESRKANCKTSQASLRQLESGQRITIVNTQGERAYLDDAQRGQEIDRVRRAVAEWCS
jgi:hypothetical protein